MARKIPKIDRVFPGVGRIARASGATTTKGFNARNNMLTRLYDMGRLDILRAIKDCDVTITEAYAADRENRLNSLVGLERALSTNLWTAVDGWVPVSAEAQPTRRRYKVSFGQLKRRWPLEGDKDQATVNSLADIDWSKLKRSWPASGSDWNHLRRAVSKFLTDKLGDVHHPFRRAVMNNKNFPKGKEVERGARHKPRIVLEDRR